MSFKFAGLGLLLALAPLMLFGQTKYNLPPKSYYEKATIGYPNFDKAEVTKLRIMADSLEYTRKGERIRLHMNDVNYIRVREGSKAKGGALIGGGSMLIISLAAVVSVQNDPNMQLRDDAAERVVLFTLGGAALGALIGAAMDSSTSYYLHITGDK